MQCIKPLSSLAYTDDTGWAIFNQKYLPPKTQEVYGCPPSSVVAEESEMGLSFSETGVVRVALISS